MRRLVQRVRVRPRVGARPRARARRRRLARGVGGAVGRARLHGRGRARDRRCGRRARGRRRADAPKPGRDERARRRRAGELSARRAPRSRGGARARSAGGTERGRVRRLVRRGAASRRPCRPHRRGARRRARPDVVPRLGRGVRRPRTRALPGAPRRSRDPRPPDRRPGGQARRSSSRTRSGRPGELWDAQVPALERDFTSFATTIPGTARSAPPAAALTVDELAPASSSSSTSWSSSARRSAGSRSAARSGWRSRSEAPERLEPARPVLHVARLRRPGALVRARAARAQRRERRRSPSVCSSAGSRTAFRAREPAAVTRFRAMLESNAARRLRRAAARRSRAGTLGRPARRDHRSDARHRRRRTTSPRRPSRRRVPRALDPGRELVVLADAAHLANVEQPDAFDRALLGHLLVPASPGGWAMSERYERGMRIRREVLGDEHVDRAIEGTNEFTADFQDLITRYAWGEIWSRPGLDRRTRSCITLTALVALGREEELAHARPGGAAQRPDARRDQGGPAPHRDLLRRAGGERRLRGRADGARRERTDARPDAHAGRHRRRRPGGPDARAPARTARASSPSCSRTRSRDYVEHRIRAGVLEQGDGRPARRRGRRRAAAARRASSTTASSCSSTASGTARR